MPEMIVVISDPRVKTPRAIPVKVVGMNDLEYNEKHKEQKVLPVAKMNPKLVDILNPPLGIVIVRIWKDKAAREKVTLAAKVIKDNSMDITVVGVPQAFLTEKVGASQTLGEVVPAPTFQIRIPEDVASKLIGLKIGDKIDGKLLGFPGIELEITGGSDLAGFPMRSDIEGTIKKYLLLSSGPGFNPNKKGERRRKLIRGNTISPDIVQVNTVIVT